MESSPRTPRTIAAEKGEVSSSSTGGDVGYCGQCGLPSKLCDHTYVATGVAGAVNGSAAGPTQYNPAKVGSGG